MGNFLLCFAVGTLLGALAGCGVGGGTLLLLFLTAVQKLPFADAKLLNLLFFIVCAAIALVSHCKNRLVDIKSAAVCAVSGVLACIPAAMLSAKLPEKVLSKIFGVLFIAAGIKELFAAKK